MNFFFDTVDQIIARFMRRWGVFSLRWALGIIFIWFGILKPFHLSPAENLVKATVVNLPLFTPDQWLVAIGWWEVLIGIAFLFQATLRLAIGLLALQMTGTFMPLITLPNVTWRHFPYAPTIEGQYIIKNLLIIAAALVVGGTVRRSTDKT